jgi:hemerythrin-like metal-binding protein
MPLEKITWDDSFSVGVAKLDRQHQRIVEIINLLMDEPEDGFDSASVENILYRLTNYVHEHFEEEEKLLAEHAYPGILEQQQEHKAFRKELADLCMIAITNHTAIPVNVHLYLREWWLDHILVRDMEYRPYLMRRDVT